MQFTYNAHNPRDAYNAKVLKGKVYMQFRHRNKNCNLYFTPLLIHQSEHHWGADCADGLYSPSL